MKKMLSLLLVFTMLLSLCACGDSNMNPDSTIQTTTTNTENQTDNTTETTQIPIEEQFTSTTEETTPSSAEEEETKPTTAPTKPVEKPTEPPKPIHTHSFSAATCTQPQKCACGATTGSVLEHNWKDATCTVAKTCSTCGTTEGTAAGHSWQEASCTTPKSCTICNITEGDVAKHIFENYICTICNATDEEGIAIATNPKLSFKPRIYQTNHYEDESTIWSYRINFDSSIGFCATRFKNTLTDYLQIQNIPVDAIPRDTEAGWGEVYYTIFNGTKYYYDGGAGETTGEFTYELTDSEIIVSSRTEVVLKFKMNIDGTLTVTYSNPVLKGSLCGFLTGDICW